MVPAAPEIAEDQIDHADRLLLDELPGLLESTEHGTSMAPRHSRWMDQQSV
jgi:hypothetical protein